MNFFADFMGSIAGGEFYRQVLKRPIKSAWVFYCILVLITGLVIGLVWGYSLLSYMNEAFRFFKDNVKEVVFESGEIKNMPPSRLELHFRDWIILFDTLYTSEKPARNDIQNDKLPVLCIGPRQAFIFTKEGSRVINYPTTYTKVINDEYLDDIKPTLRFAIFALAIVSAVLYRAIVGLLYVLIIITPIVIFKFRRMGMAFGDGFKTALYLVSFQIVFSSLLLILNLNLPWAFLIIIFFYIFYIGALVNIDLSYSDHQPNVTEKTL